MSVVNSTACAVRTQLLLRYLAFFIRHTVMAGMEPIVAEWRDRGQVEDFTLVLSRQER